MKVYLFTRKHSRVTHAIVTTMTSLGSFELDRLFGRGFRFLCTGKRGEGLGTLSECPMTTSHVTCKKCIRKIKQKGMSLEGPLTEESWPPKAVRPMKRPTFLGVPG